MSSLSANMYSVVKNVMARTGVSATLICPSGGNTYDPNTSTVTYSEVEYPVRVIVMDFALITNGLVVEKNSLISSNDKQVYMDATQSNGSQPALPVTANGCKLRVGSKEYRITVVKQYNPSTLSTIMYDLKVEE